MRWKTLLTVLTPVFLLAGCDSVPAEPETPQLTEPDFSATVIMTNTKLPLGPPRTFIPCANDGIGEYANAVDPWIHLILRQVVDANDGYHFYLHSQPIGNWTFVGEITGDKYRATGLSQWQSNEAADWAPYIYTHVNSFKLIGPGPGNNLLITQVEHYTWNANDVLTAEVSNASVECR